MRNEIFDEAVARILAKDRRYPREAYVLLPATLDYTVRELQKKHLLSGPNGQHVTGRQLAEGFRDYMLDEYGPFAYELLRDLHISSTDDIGNIVYNLIDVGMFGKTANDSLSDFHALYDFQETFVRPYRAHNVPDDTP